MNAAVLPATPRPNISFDRVSQVFTSSDGSAVVALDNASFDIGRHEFIAVLGPSGCGKSTLLRILAGLVRPTHGQVSIYGSPVDGPRDEIGIVFQKPTLLPWLNIRDNLTFPMRHKYGRVTAQEIIRGEELLELVGLKEFGNKRPDELSGGMQQRAAVARAVLHPRRPDPRRAEPGAAEYLDPAPEDGAVHHPLDSRSAAAGRPHPGDVGTPRPRSGNHRRRPAAPAVHADPHGAPFQ